MVEKLKLPIRYEPGTDDPIEAVIETEPCTLVLSDSAEGDPLPLAHLLAHFVLMHPLPWEDAEEEAAGIFADAFLAEAPVATER